MDDAYKDQGKTMVSVVVPAYNEESILKDNLRELCRYLKALEDRHTWEIIVVNDGSTDKTGDIADAFALGAKNVKVLHHPYNFRLGQALRFAFSKCRGSYIVVMDADLSYSPSHIKKMLDKLYETHAKIVIASPYAKGGKVSNVPWVRKTMSYWANRFLSFLATKDYYSEKLTNITGMVRAYDSIFLKQLNTNAMDVDINPEIIYKAKILRARIVEVPAHLKWKKKQGKKRESNLRIARSIMQSVLSGFILRPFMFFVLPGLSLLALSLYPLFWTLYHTIDKYMKFADLGGSVDHRLSEAMAAAFRLSPHAFIVGGVALVVAIQLLSLGLLAYQKKRYFQELFHLGSMLHRNNLIHKEQIDILKALIVKNA
ncbi:glycosyltransferase family 2 protein [Acidobacteriota bacterium]